MHARVNRGIREATSASSPEDALAKSLGQDATVNADQFFATFCFSLKQLITMARQFMDYKSTESPASTSGSGATIWS